MQLRRRVALTSIVFFVVSLVLTLALVMSSEYRLNDISYIGEEELQAQVIDDLNIEGNYFLLTPKMYVEYRLNRLEYVKNASVEKELPNLITISYETNTPSFCDTDFVYFAEYTVPRTEENESMCFTVPEIEQIERFNQFEDFVKEYEQLLGAFRDDVSSVISVDNYYLFTMKDTLTIKVFLEDFNKLNNYSYYQTDDNELDLRPNYS